MSSITRLSELQSTADVSKIVTQSLGSKPLDAASVSALCETLFLLKSPTSSQLGFLPASLTLVTSSSDKEGPSLTAQEFLNDLTHIAHVTSASLACSSVLAGLSSESDEYGDVGLWLGDLPMGEAREENIVRILGLEHWLQTGGRIVITEPSPHALPAGLAQIPHLDRRADIEGLTSLISKLEQRFEFRLEGADKGGRVIWFLLGRLALESEQAWVGLVGAGVLSEESE